jgi:drug/metabolite transporter (DMT)-like permease
VFVPLGHGGVIQPSCAALGGLILARLVLKEPLPPRRIAGALLIVVGLAVIGSEAVRTMGPQGILGDLLFVLAGCFFATFGILVRRWQIAPLRAAAITSVLSLTGLPLLLLGVDKLFASSFLENLMQAIVQGALTGAGATYLFARAVVLLGAGRAVLFPSLVPPFTLLVGFLALGEVPSASQLIGLAVVVVGFPLTQRG